MSRRAWARVERAAAVVGGVRLLHGGHQRVLKDRLRDRLVGGPQGRDAVEQRDDPHHRYELRRLCL